MSWKKVKLGELLTESKIPCNNPNPDRRIKVKLKVLGVEKRSLENEIEGATKQYIRKAGQFIYGKQNFHKGAFGIIPKELDGFESSADLPAFDVSKNCLPEWIFYFFKQGNYYLQLSKIARGVATQRIHPEQIYDLEIPLPDLKTQKKFLTNIYALENQGEELSTELTHQQDLLKQLRLAFLREAMQGKLLAKANEENEFLVPPAKAGGNSKAGDNLDKAENNSNKAENNSNKAKDNSDKTGGNSTKAEGNSEYNSKTGENSKNQLPLALASGLKEKNTNGFSQTETGQTLLEKIKAEKSLPAGAKRRQEKPLPPIKEEEIPFEIPGNWVWCRLGEIALAANNGLYKHESFYKESGFISLRMFNIQEGQIVTEKVRRVVLDEKELQTYLLEENDILFNRVNSLDLVGKSAIVKDIGEPLVYESMNMRLRLIFKNEMAAFINYLLLEKRTRDYFYFLLENHRLWRW